MINEYQPAKDSPSAGGPDDLAVQAGLNDVDRGGGFVDDDYEASGDDDDSDAGGQEADRTTRKPDGITLG